MVFDEVAARHRSAGTGDAPENGGAGDSIWRRPASASPRWRSAAYETIHRSVTVACCEDARTEKDRAERALAERSAQFRDVQSGIRVLLPEVRAALPPGSALVILWVRQIRAQPDGTSQGDPVPSYLAFVSTGSERRPTLVPLGSAARVESLILQWRRQLDQEAIAAGMGASRSEAAYRRVAGQLRQQIWDPLLPHLAKATRVFVVPDGALHLVSLPRCRPARPPISSKRGLRSITWPRNGISCQRRGPGGRPGPARSGRRRVRRVQLGSGRGRCVFPRDAVGLRRFSVNAIWAAAGVGERGR